MCVRYLLYVNSVFGLPPPNDEESVLDTLKDKISSIETLKEMKQFRNVLVHKYGEVDTGKVYENASTRLDDFYAFMDEIKQILENKNLE